MARKYIYIFGILFLLVVGFLVYYFRNQLFPMEGFQAAAGTPEVFTLYKEKCVNGPVTKIQAMDLCGAVGARLATYDELFSAAEGGFIIDNISSSTLCDGVTTSRINAYTNILADIATGTDKVVLTTNIGSSIDPNCMPTLTLGSLAAGLSAGVVIAPKDNINGRNGVFVLDSDVIYKTSTVTKRPLVPIASPSGDNPPPTLGFPLCYGVKPATQWIGIQSQYDLPYYVAKIIAYVQTTYSVTLASFTGQSRWSTRNYYVRSKTSPAFTCSLSASGMGSPYPSAINTIPVVDANPTPLSGTDITQYNILDLDKVYLQLDIAKVDIPTRRDALKTSSSSSSETAISSTLKSWITDAIAAAKTLFDTKTAAYAAIGPVSASNLLAAMSANKELADAATAYTNITNSNVNSITNAITTKWASLNPSVSIFNYIKNDPDKENMRRVILGYVSLINEQATNGTTYTNLQTQYESMYGVRIPYYNPLSKFVAASTSSSITPTQYANILSENVDIYYTSLLNAFAIHPIAFLRKSTMSFPSMLNTFKIYNFPIISDEVDMRLVGGVDTQPQWEISGSNNRRLTCVDGLSNKEYQKGSIADWDFRESSQTVLDHNPSGDWCVNYSNTLSVAGCPSGHWPRSWRMAACTKEYYRNTAGIGETDYMIGTNKIQRAFETGTLYNGTIDMNWRANKDNGPNPIPIPASSPRRTIQVVGKMSATNMTEINRSISLALCFNFTDTSTIESQIRISSKTPYSLHMSFDATALPEFINKMDTSTSTSTITASNADHNDVHCGILLRYTDFYLLPYHTRDIINRWATSRYSRVVAWAAGSGSALSSAVGGQVTWQEGSTAAAGFLSGPLPTTNVSQTVKGSFFNTSILSDVRYKLLDEIAQFYYNNETNYMGTQSGSLRGETIMNKIVDVFQIGDTIFDVRFEEYSKRGIMFREKLAQLNTEYDVYKNMNISEADRLSLSQRYLENKKRLYLKDALNIWGTTQDCGTNAQYVIITTTDYFFISQVVIINSAGQNISSACNIEADPALLYYSSQTDDPTRKSYYDDNGKDMTPENATIARRNLANSNILNATQLMIDGIQEPKWYPSVFKSVVVGTSTSGSRVYRLVFDLGNAYDISTIRIVLPNDITSATWNPYSVFLTNDSSVTTVGQTGIRTGNTIVYNFAGTGDDAATCPAVVFERFKVARFYTSYSPSTTAKPWTVTGYSKGVSGALTFDPKYNAGMFIDRTINGGNLVYSPNIVYNLNYGGSPPTLVCSNPEQIKTIFNDYNILVNSQGFQNVPGNSILIDDSGKSIRASLVTKSRQIDSNTCGYVWTDTLTDMNSGNKTSKERIGRFPYVVDTQIWNADQRVFDMNNTSISNRSSSSDETGYTALSPSISLPESYIQSTVLDDADGFCPEIPCSDIRVMQSVVEAYNSQVSTYGANFPTITKIHKAVTPTRYRCEFLVETSSSGSGSSSGSSSGSNTLRKVMMYIKTMRPNTIGGNLNCLWIPLVKLRDDSGTESPGVRWDIAPNLLDSNPYLTRIFNYAFDILRPFRDSVTTIVNDLVGLGSAQLNPSGSGIVNALMKYRTETAAAAGEIRYFDEVDEMGNMCAPLTGSSGLYTSENYPRCRSPAALNSLYSYYRNNNPLGLPTGTVSRITNMLRAGQTDDGSCDYTFSRNDYRVSSGSIVTTPFTSGLRCSVQRVAFSCNYNITSCSPINPSPSQAEISAIPSQFVQRMQFGSGSGSGSSSSSGSGSGSGSGSSPPAITAAGLQATYGSQSLVQPSNSNSLLPFVDYIPCNSTYAKISLGLPSSASLSNLSLTRCSVGGEFVKIPPNMIYTYLQPGSGSSTSSPVTTNVDTVSEADARRLLPYTLFGTGIKISPGVYEYRITADDKLPFGDTYVRAQFYLDTTSGSSSGLQLSSLQPATPVNSPNAFYNTTPAINTVEQMSIMAQSFLAYWNATFTYNMTNKINGTKISAITGYSINTGTDTILFRATAARFGTLGPYDIRAYSATAYFRVGFRKSYAGGIRFVYSASPLTTSETLDVMSGNAVTFTSISVTFSPDDTPTYIVQSQTTIMAQGRFRSFRFSVQAVNGGGARAEIARMFFYNTVAGSTVPVDPSSATVSVQGILANYILPPSQTACKTGYSLLTNPTTTVQECIAPQTSYTRVANTACGIGYYFDGNGNCVSSGYFQDVLSNTLINVNALVSRLRLNLGQYMYVDFGSIVNINAYSFTVGSAATAPIKWILEGSVDNVNWVSLHGYSAIPYVYAPPIVSFYNPGIFAFFSTANAGSAPQAALYSQQAGNITEGFKSPDKTARRFRTLRWKIHETQVPTATYVHASSLQFHTMAGPIPASTMKLSNPQGSRRSSANAPEKALSTDGGRWVDYNKTDLIISFHLDTLPANPIYGFQFAVPPKVANSVDFVPAKWLLEGSYDGRIWVPLHEKVDRARILGDASPIYKFTQQI